MWNVCWVEDAKSNSAKVGRYKGCFSGRNKAARLQKKVDMVVGDKVWKTG